MSKLEDNKSKILQIIGVVLFLILMALIVTRKPRSKSLSSHHPNVDFNEEKSELHAQDVSMHMKDLEYRRLVEQQKVQLENMRVAPAPRLDNRQTGFPKEYGVNLEQEADTVLEDIKREKLQAEEKVGPRDFIYQEMALESNSEVEQVIKEHGVDQQQARYIREIMARARKDGFELIINKDLMVIGYRKIDPITGRASARPVYLESPKYGQ